MKKFGRELEFISRINRDGKSLDLQYNFSICQNIEYELRPLSLSEGTYIAANFNLFIVKVRK